MLYEPIRKILCPFNKIEPLVPQSGDILDIGCGHGTFAEILADSHPKRKILGVDPAKEKIKLAKEKQKKYKNISFKSCYFDKLPVKKYDCIILIDVTYLLPYKEKVEFLKKVKKYLKPKGTLVMKTESTEPKIIFKLLQIEETLMVKIFRYTYSDKKDFFFTDKKSYRKVLKEAGFKIKEEHTFQSLFPYKHPTFVALKK